jgi:hypothetical protein
MGSTCLANQESTKKTPHNQNVLGHSILNETHYVGEHSRKSQYIRVKQLGSNYCQRGYKTAYFNLE